MTVVQRTVSVQKLTWELAGPFVGEKPANTNVMLVLVTTTMENVVTTNSIIVRYIRQKYLGDR